jgi:hypothetical protein
MAIERDWRPKIDDDNTERAEAASRVLREKYGADVSPTKIINAVLRAADLVEFTQEIRVTLTAPDPTGTVPVAKRKRKYRSRETWATHL